MSPVLAIVRQAALLSSLLALLACSGQIRDQGVRERYLERFLALSERHVLVSVLPLHGEPQLALFGLDDPGERFTRQFALDRQATPLAERFLALAPLLAPATIIRPAELHRQFGGLDGDEPVLLMHSNWRLLYRRLPPDLGRHRLQLSVQARILPLRVVRSGRGLLALPVAAWQSACVHEARGGEFLSLDEWGANDGEPLRVALDEAQSHCARELAAAFAEALGRRRGPPNLSVPAS